jgi:hypothetical protein
MGKSWEYLVKIIFNHQQWDIMGRSWDRDQERGEQSSNPFSIWVKVWGDDQLLNSSSLKSINN